MGATPRESAMLVLARRAVYLAAGHRRWPWILVLVGALAVSVVETVGAVLIFNLLRLVTNPNGSVVFPVVGDVRAHIGGDDDRHVVTVAAAVVAAFFVLRAGLVIASSYLQARVTQSAGARLAARLHAGYLRMPYSTYVTANSSIQIRNIQDGVQRIVADVFVSGARMVSELVLIVVLSIVLIVASPIALLLVIVVVAPVLLLINRFVHPAMTRRGREAQDLSGENLQLLQESIHGLRDIRLLGRERYFADVFAGARARLGRNRQVRTVLQDVPTAALETAFVLFITGFLAYTALAKSDPESVLPVLGMFAYVGLRLKPSLNQVVAGVNSLRFAGATVNDIYADLRQAEHWVGRGADDDDVRLAFTRELTLDSVSFTYDSSTVPALRDVTMRIERGASVGIVGHTGGGKSTLLDVLTGLLVPESGAVLVDGVDIRTAPRSWQRRLGVVSQSTFLVDDTIRRNIGLGEPDEAVDDARVESAVDLAQLRAFVETLPEGLDTRIGERGVRLSGGQRQRVAIARALYRQPDVLILDEGTSALDTRTENELMSAVEKLRGEYTIVMVAHRLSTVQRCDVIYVIEAGRVVATGTWESLADESTTFRQLTQ